MYLYWISIYIDTHTNTLYTYRAYVMHFATQCFMTLALLDVTFIECQYSQTSSYSRLQISLEKMTSEMTLHAIRYGCWVQLV